MLLNFANSQNVIDLQICEIRLYLFREICRIKKLKRAAVIAHGKIPVF